MPPADRPSMPRPSHVLVVDGDRRVRQSLADLIGLAEELELTGAVADVDAAIGCLELGPPDILVIDPHLPDEAAGMALLGTLQRRWPSTAVVVISCLASLEAPSMALGAVAFVPKAGDPESLVEALLSAARNRPAA